MTPKTTNILYWVTTSVFSLLMIFSSIGGLGPNEQTIEFLHEGLGFPIYFIQFISIAKIIGSVAILVASFRRIKEWAYAGLFFDLTGAIFSGIASSGKFDPLMLSMLIWIVPGVASYMLWHKKLAA
jgi:hypothetical protein